MTDTHWKSAASGAAIAAVTPLFLPLAAGANYSYRLVAESIGGETLAPHNPMAMAITMDTDSVYSSFRWVKFSPP